VFGTLQHQALWRQHESSDLQIAADGASSSLLSSAEQLSNRVRNVQLKENRKQTRVYRTLIMPLPENDPEWPSTAAYSERSPAGRVLECLPTREGAPLDVAAKASMLGLCFPELWDVAGPNDMAELVFALSVRCSELWNRRKADCVCQNLTVCRQLDRSGALQGG
jgi:hypothetical protein